MKALLTTVLLAVSFFCASIWADVPVDGRWDGGGLRSTTPIPAQPGVSIEGNTVSIYLMDALSDLTVYIMDDSGIVYETVVSSNGNSNYTCELPWIGQPGDYQIVMVHGRYGYLGGNFSID